MSTSTESTLEDDVLHQLSQLKLSSTNVKNAAIQRINNILKNEYTKISEEQLNLICLNILKTYLNYPSDSKFNKSILQSFTLFLSINADKYTKVFSKFINSLSSKPQAPTDLLILLEWNIHISYEVAKLSKSQGAAEELISSSVNLIDLIGSLEQETVIHSEQKQHQKRILNAAQRHAKQSVVSMLIIDPTLLDVYVKVIGNASLPISGRLFFAGFLSYAASYCSSSLKSTDLLDALSSKNAELMTFFTKDVLSTKVIPQRHSLDAFGHFIFNHISATDLESTFLPALEKAALRNSELVLGRVTSHFFDHLNDSKIDICQSSSKGKLLGQLIAGFKSLKESVRAGSAETLKIILTKSSTTSQEHLISITDELIKVLKSLATTATDQKVQIGKTLSYVPKISESVVLGVVTGLLPLVVKDSNEISLTAQLHTFMSHLIYLLSKGETVIESKITDAIKTGLQEKKQNLRKCWIITFSKAIMESEMTSKLAEFLNIIIPLLLNTFNECVNSPLASVTNKLIAAGYATITVTEFLKGEAKDQQLTTLLNGAAIFEKSIADNEKPSILLNHKIYSKYSNEEEQKWFVKSLAALSKYITLASSDFGYAWLYSCVSPAISYNVRRLAITLLENSYHTNQQYVSASVIAALNRVLANPSESKELDFSRISPVITAITNPSKSVEKSLLEQQLVDLLVASHHSSMHAIKGGWIDICLKSSMDPGSIATSNSELIVSKLSTILLEATDETHSSGIYQAVCNSIATLSFISTDTIVPKLSTIISQDLDITHIHSIDDVKYGIWKAPEGELVVNVLEKTQKKQQIDKNSKDYETLKWEESVRKSSAAKKTVSKKYTKEEQLLVDQQLQLESEIRREITQDYNRLRRALEIIIYLSKEASKVSNGSPIWFPVAISGILDLFKSTDCKRLVGSLATECFLVMSTVLPTQSLSGNSSLDWIGATTLRLYGIDFIPEKYTSQPLSELLSSQLFGLKLASDKMQFDSLTLMYILTLLVKIVENGKNHILKSGKKAKAQVNSEFSEEDPEEEQLSMAIEIISAHCEVFQDKSIPRTAIVVNLLSLMTVPAKAKISKDCFKALAQNISVNISNDDLHLILSKSIDPSTFVRTAVLEVLDEEFDLSDLGFNEELCIAAFDNEELNSAIAKTIWEESGFQIDATAPKKLIPYLGNPDTGIRLSTARALANSVIELKSNESFIQILNDLLELYKVKDQPPPPIKDEYGLIIKSSAEQKDTWEERSGVALCLKYLAPLFTASSDVELVFKFLINEKGLGDKEPIVRQELQDAGMSIINAHGKVHVETLIPIFEAGLNAKDQGTRIQDHIKESIIILYGNLARHLDESDNRIDEIVSRLLKALDTPSEDVQFAVSECIAPLVSATKTKLGSYFDSLFEKLFTGNSLAKRRGAAYGIAGLVKGAGLKSLAENDIMRNLTEASDDKRDPKRREGVSFSFETLSQSLGPLFEPYVIEILPIVLKFLGDQTPEVREAADYAARMIMKNTTSYGIKKLIPLAVGNLDDIAWRTKKGSVELLGSMAYLDPTQLSASLPTIVPEIVSVLNDSHKEVRKAADQSLKRFGEVIRNPEIQELVPTLLKAIGDPTKYTTDALDSLIQTQFVHYIDGPSLALIIHVIHRGMHDRSATTKRKACQIVGNMSILVDSKDLIPYLPELVVELEEAMVDPVPQTRATAARALGSLVEKLGEERFPDLIPRLIATLQDESRSGDRIGSAQALAEVISGIGLTKLDELLPTILAGTTSPKAYIRSGFMPLLLFLPVCFGNQFAPYLSRTIPPILSGLADLDEDIRDTALRSGRLIVSNYANKAVDLLLPELERGMSESNPRIRLSSVELTGDLLFKISGITGKLELSEDFTTSSSDVNKAFDEVLGTERRDRVLALLFVCRSDTSGPVRVATVNIWKALVASTPKTVREILPTLTQIIVRKLASPDEEQRAIAATTLGEMVKRVGGNALSQLLPTLEESLIYSDSDAKQGICIAVRELIESTTTDNVIEYQEILFNIIRDALVDPNPGVREAAAQAFDVLQDAIGNTAVDEIIPRLLEMLDSDDSDNALSALEGIMATKADVIFPILIPSLLTPPINARALGALAEVAGSALYRRLSTIMNALIDAVIFEAGDKQELLNALTRTLLAVDSDQGSHPLMQQILLLMRHEDARRVAIIYKVLPEFFASSTLDYSAYTQDVVTQCILSLDDPDQEVARNSFEALSALVKKQPKESLEKLVAPAQQTLSSIGAEDQDLYVFSLPKGPNCLLPIFLHGLMYGSSNQREQSASGIADIVERTPAASLKPFVTVIVGPLIRVIGERFSGDVKSAILLALNKLFAKVPQFLRPFIPQLQRTFVKSLSDTSNELLRSRAAKALGTLIEFQPRVDPLVTELLSGAKSAVGSENAGVKTAMLKALLEVVSHAGNKMSESSKSGVLSLIESEMFSDGAALETTVAYAKLIGALSKILSKDEASKILRSKVLDAQLSDINSASFAVLTLNAFLKDSPEHIFGTDLFNDTVDFINKASGSKMPYVSDNATMAAGKLLLSLDNLESKEDSQLAIAEIIKQLCFSMISPTSNSLDTRRLALVVVRTVCRFQYELCIKPNISVLAPAVFSCIRDPVIPIKLAAEKSYLAIFELVNDSSATFFESFVKNSGETITSVIGTVIQVRSLSEYTKRIALRLAASERERIAAGGDLEAMFSDQYEDEQEIWAIGAVDLNKE
ncbi:hypothetical protein CANARDRAFT_29904 [[Candida] arabinofermentans NRRL YB-2248]|uniref:TOG domain-containing protein n=1 Tax=[Candida] arabinofermentans NRRL YB-2248 TaxID=983967 RepID=A0A1E4SVD2_9ASCO|nr:hypothetical protein CANARDRAFT_29904 [[Candida] arabinofermentans NRRL YB-2248]